MAFLPQHILRPNPETKTPRSKFRLQNTLLHQNLFSFFTTLGREEAQLKSSERLEKLMHLVADRLTGLSSLMDSHPTVYEESAASDLDPVVRQEEERLMYKQLQIQGQMGLIQAALRSLTGALAKMEANKQQVKELVDNAETTFISFQ